MVKAYSFFFKLKFIKKIKKKKKKKEEKIKKLFADIAEGNGIPLY